MTPAKYRSSKPAHCVSPRPHTDASLRRKHYGPLQPAERPATTLDLLRFGMPGGIGMAVLFAVSTIAIVAFKGGI